MKKTQELTLKIEDLEERIAPHINVYLPEVSNVVNEIHGELVNDQISVSNSGHVHGSVGPEADFIRPHRG